MRSNFAHPFFYVILTAAEGPALHAILTERSEWKDLIALGLLPSKKEEWKNAHANKNAFAAFSIPLFFTQALASRAALCHGERQPNHLPFCSAHFYITSSILSCLLERQSRGLLT